MQSSAMASLLAEEDIVRREPNERMSTEQILRQQQRQERQEAEERRERVLESKRRQEAAAQAERREHQDQYEAMLQQRRQQEVYRRQPQPQEAHMHEMRRALPPTPQQQQQHWQGRQEDDEGLRRLQLQQEEVMRMHQERAAVEGRGAPPPFMPPTRAQTADMSPPQQSERNRSARERAWGSARAGEVMSPERSEPPSFLRGSRPSAPPGVFVREAANPMPVPRHPPAFESNAFEVRRPRLTPPSSQRQQSLAATPMSSERTGRQRHPNEQRATEYHQRTAVLSQRAGVGAGVVPGAYDMRARWQRSREARRHRAGARRMCEAHRRSRRTRRQLAG
jgi:hypothetical protein